MAASSRNDGLTPELRRLITNRVPLRPEHRADAPVSAQNPRADREELLEQLLGPEGLAEKRAELELARLQSYWPDVAGGLSKHVQPSRIQGDRLYVRVEKSVYAQELQLLSREILSRAARLCGCQAARLYIEKGPIDWQAYSGNRTPAVEGGTRHPQRSVSGAAAKHPRKTPDSANAPADNQSDDSRTPDEGRRLLLEGLRKLQQ